MEFADWKSQNSEVETSWPWPRRVAGGCTHKVVIVLDGADDPLVAWIHLPEGLLECVLQKLLLKDRHAPRVATVHSSWSFAMDKCLISYCDGDHLWWSPPFEPLLPHLEDTELLSHHTRSPPHPVQNEVVFRDLKCTQIVHGFGTRRYLCMDKMVSTFENEEAWLSGQLIDSFMGWVIHYDLPAWSHILDDATAAHTALVHGTYNHIDMADSIYLPTWIVGPMLQSERVVRAKVDSPHICQAPGYKMAMQAAKTKEAVAFVNRHWVTFRLVESTATLYVWDWMARAIVQRQTAENFLLFFSILLSDDKYLTYSIVIYDASSLISLPHQTDSSSCGVFASIFLYHLYKDAKVHFTQEQMLR